MSFFSQNILFKHQYRFRSKHPTIHPVLHLLNKCAQNNNTLPKSYTMSIFCDLSKTFDVINHKILIQNSTTMVFEELPKKWLINYLTNRTQFVEMENTKSQIINIECGVPQGSILGPLLYLIYCKINQREYSFLCG